MELIRPHKTHNRMDSFFGHDSNTEESVVLTTLTSRLVANVEGNDVSQLEYSLTDHLRHESRLDESPSEQSTATTFSGWRLGAAVAGCLAIISLAMNSAAAIYLANHRKTPTSLVEIYRGDCDKVHSLDLWLHLLINLISTLLLGGSNYCMQCLCSPDRDELDRAHAKGIPLDIGVLSPRNLFAIGKLKCLLWWLFALSSIPLHLIYNSAFYASIGARDYNLYIIQPEFLAGYVTYDQKLLITNTSTDSWSTSVTDPVIVYQNYTKSDQFQNLTNLECIQAYAKAIPTDWSTLLLVTDNSSSRYSVPAAQFYLQKDKFNPLEGKYAPFDWICTGDPNLGSKINHEFKTQWGYRNCDEYVSKIESIANEWVVLNESVSYCLAERAEQQCTFNGNFQIMVLVSTCNLVKAVVMIYLAIKLQSPLITLGDAIQSFLDKPDATTRGLCWVTRREILDYATYAYHFPHAPWPANTANAKMERRTVSLRDRRWLSAAGHTRWVGTITSISLALAVCIGLFIYGYRTTTEASGSALSHQIIKQLGFGVIQPLTIIIGGWVRYSPTNQIFVSVLIANSPQIALSLLYVNINGLMTSMWLGEEWHRFATQRKYLRVSSPRGNQRSSHFLHLPYKISIPMMITSSLLHWLLSRSIFLAVVAEYNQVGDLVNPTLVASCGYSLLAMIITIVLTFVITIGVVGLSFRRYDGRIPLVGSCSAAISAACHRPVWDHDAALKPVQYGRLGSNDGHLCFTSAEVEFAIEGRKYAGD